MVAKTVGKCFAVGASALAAVACFFALTPHSSSPTPASNIESNQHYASSTLSEAQASSPQSENTNDLLGSAAAAVTSAKNDAINAALDATGAKTAVQNALISHSEDISDATGLADNQVQTIITNMDIPSWQVTDLPHDTVETNVVSGTYAGVKAQVTTYADPSYVSIEAYGQDFTLAVPTSAQQYMSLLAFAG